MAENPAILDRLEAIATAQKAYHDQKQREYPTIETFLDEEGYLHLPADIAPLLSQSSYNGRYSEADWWLSTIHQMQDDGVGDVLPQDVVNLVIAAREFWQTNEDMSDESRALDQALEAFVDRVPYENEPDGDLEYVCDACASPGYGPDAKCSCTTIKSSGNVDD